MELSLPANFSRVRIFLLFFIEKSLLSFFTSMQLLDGKKVAQILSHKLHKEVAAFQKKQIQPKLVIIFAGDNPASLSYIRAKRKASENLGITAEVLQFQTKDIDTSKLLELIQKLNNDASVNGILVQLPLPEHIYAPEIIKAIHPDKDVDGFTAYNLGKMFLSTEFEELVPCTPLGIVHLLDHYQISLQGKEIVVVGASNIVGKPMAAMLVNRRATVTICHSKTKNLAAHTRRAEILIAATGNPHLITQEMVTEGAVVIDVGINRLDGKLVGDVDFHSVAPKTSYITPVPGGCGPMTVVCLMENICKATKKQYLKKSFQNNSSPGTF